MSTIRFTSRKAPATDRAPAAPALVLCAHGARGGLSAAPAHAARLARLGRFSAVRWGCVTGEPELTAVIGSLPARDILIAPLLMAEGYTADEVLPTTLAGLAQPGRVLTLCRPVGSHPRIAALIGRAARETCAARGWNPEETALIVLGHGTPRNAASAETARRHSAALARARVFARVEAAFLEQPPDLPETLRRCAGERHAVIVGLFADRGLHADQDVPRLLRETGSAAAYAGPVGARPEIADLILDQVAAVSRSAA